MRSLSLLALMSACAVAAAQATSSETAKIVDEGKNRNQVMKTLRELTNIGPRLTSSPNLRRAQEFAMKKFKSYGLKNVHLDEWGTVPVSFERGKNQSARLILPFESENIQFTTMNWMPGTNGKQRGKAVKAPATVEEANAMRSAMRGAWVVMPGNWTMRGPAGAAQDEEARKKEAEIKAIIDGAGILGRVYGARDERLHSSGSWRDKTLEKHPEGPANVMIVVRKSDHDKVLYHIENRLPVELEFEAENRFLPGGKQYNVVADIPGTERPNEMVIVCGHLDSWNSPGSQGAVDNGTGSVNTIEAARILMAAGVKPKRTIRFILWSGEEQGLLGSRGYVEKHKNEMDGVSAVLNDDGGSNYQGGYVGVANMKEMLEAAFAPTVAAFPDLPMSFDTAERMPAGGSSDHASFNAVGVPGFFTKESSNKELGDSNYGYGWHTQYDRYERAIPRYLVQSSTNNAVVAYYLAQAPTLLPRAPKPERPSSLSDLPKAIAVGSDQITYPWIMLFDEHEDGKPHDHEDDWTLEVIDRVKRSAWGIFTFGKFR